MTRRQSDDQWSGGVAAHPAPKIPIARIRWKSSRLDFLEWRRLPPHWLYSNRSNYQCRVLLICAGAIEGHFEGKMPREVHQGVIVLARQCTRRNCPTWASNVLITHPILRTWPRRTTTCSLDWQTIERSPFFVRRGGHCCRGDLVGRTTFWFFFGGGACKI